MLPPQRGKWGNVKTAKSGIIIIKESVIKRARMLSKDMFKWQDGKVKCIYVIERHIQVAMVAN